MKVHQKFFVVALLLSLILSVGAVMAQDDMTFEQSNLEENSIETDNELDVNQGSGNEKLSDTDPDNENEDVDKLSKTEEGANQPDILKMNFTRIDVSGNSFEDIQKAIDEATNGTTIYLNSPVYYGNGKEITIGQELGELKIIGNAPGSDYVTLDAKELSRIFSVAGTRVTMQGIKFINGKVTEDNGGAVDWSGINGVLISSAFINNSAKDGGAIIANANYLSIYDSTFINNKAAFQGGAIYAPFMISIFNSYFENNAASTSGGAVYFSNSGDVRNCNFVNNTATDGNGGAIFSSNHGNVKNCNFVNNNALYGGAVLFQEGNVTNCNFTDNSATYRGGALFFSEGGDVRNCNFTGNNAFWGSAIYFNHQDYSGTLTISNSILLNNRANVDDNAPLNVTVNDNNITITFVGCNNFLNAIYSRYDGNVTFRNVTYWGAKGITTGTSTLSRSSREAGQNITIAVVVNDKIVFNGVNVTDDNGTIVLDIKVESDYYIYARHNLDSYYTEAETVLTNMSYYANVMSQTTNNKTVNITAKSNIHNEFMPGKLRFILPNGAGISANYSAGGIWWAVYEFNDIGDYNVGAEYIGLDEVTIRDGTIRILDDVPIIVGDMSINFGDAADVVVNVPSAIDGQKIRIIVGSTSKDAIVKNGMANASFTDLAAGEHVILVDYFGDGYNSANSTTAKLTVNKISSKVIVEPIANITYGDVATIIVTVPADATGKVFVNLGIAKSYGEIKDGKAIITIPALPKGTYTVNAMFEGDSKYDASNGTGSFEVIKDPEYFIKAIMINGLQLTCVLTDDEGKAVAGAVVLYTLDVDKVVNVTTNDKGEFVCDIKSNSILTMSYTDGNVSCSESIVIKNIALTQKGTQIVVPSNMQRTAVDYNAGEKGFDFTFKLLDSDGKPLANKAVKIGIFDKTYTVKTNKDGVGALPINIANANYYTYAVVFLGDDDYKASMGVCSLQIVKKSVTITPAKTSYSFASNAKTKTVTATLKSTNSYIPKGKQVTLTIAGKTFKTTIGDKGQINFNIGSITKKGTYKVDIKFAGTNTYAAANSKTITIKIA